MPDDDSMLGQNMIDVRNEERAARNGRTLIGLHRRPIQTPACDRCTQGVMDATNDHLLGLCDCECHK